MRHPFFIAVFVCCPSLKLRRRAACCLGERLDSGGQTALVASSLVLVDDVFVSHAVDNAAGFTQRFASHSLVAGSDGLTDALDSGTQHRAQAGVVLVTLNRLASALASLGGIGHVA